MPDREAAIAAQIQQYSSVRSLLDAASEQQQQQQLGARVAARSRAGQDSLSPQLRSRELAASRLPFVAPALVSGSFDAPHGAQYASPARGAFRHSHVPVHAAPLAAGELQPERLRDLPMPNIPPPSVSLSAKMPRALKPVARSERLPTHDESNPILLTDSTAPLTAAAAARNRPRPSPLLAVPEADERSTSSPALDALDRIRRDSLAVGDASQASGSSATSSRVGAHAGLVIAEAGTTPTGPGPAAGRGSDYLGRVLGDAKSMVAGASRERELQMREAVKKLFSLCRHNRVRQIEEMLEGEGLAVSMEDEHGNTILHIACQNGHKRVAKLFLRRGGRVNVQNNAGQTCLHYCMEYGYADLAQYLKTKGADDSLRNMFGLTCYEGLRPDFDGTGGGGGDGDEPAEANAKKP